MLFSPWLLLVLIVCVIPAFLGESHFAFLGYSLAFSQTPVKRQMDYLRFLGVSKDSAKELKVFGLNTYLTDRFAKLADDYLHNKMSGWPSADFWPARFSTLLSTIGYYGAYAFVIYQTLSGQDERRHTDLLAGAIAGSQRQPADDFFHFFQHCRPVLLSDRPAGILRCTSQGSSPSPMAFDAHGPSPWELSFATSAFSYPGAVAPRSSRSEIFN